MESLLAMPTTSAFFPRSGCSRIGSGCNAGSSGAIAVMTTSLFQAESGPRSASGEHISGVNRDHLFFVGGDHPSRRRARVGGDARSPGGVGGGVEADAQPLGALAHVLSDGS